MLRSAERSAITAPKRFDRLETSSSGERSLMRSYHLSPFPHTLPRSRGRAGGGRSMSRLRLAGHELRLAVCRVGRHAVLHAVVRIERGIVFRLQRADTSARGVVPDLGRELDELRMRSEEHT